MKGHIRNAMRTAAAGFRGVSQWPASTVRFGRQSVKAAIFTGTPLRELFAERLFCLRRPRHRKLSA